MSQRQQFVDFAYAQGPALLRRARLLTGDKQLAEDLVQTTFLKVYLAWGRSSEWESPPAYAQRVMYTSFCAWRRRSWRNETPTAVMPEPARQAAGAEPDVVMSLSAALARLPRKQRAALVARFYDDLSVEESARLLGCSPGTIKSQTARGLESLRRDIRATAAMGERS